MIGSVTVVAGLASWRHTTPYLITRCALNNRELPFPDASLLRSCREAQRRYS